MRYTDEVADEVASAGLAINGALAGRKMDDCLAALTVMLCKSAGDCGISVEALLLIVEATYEDCKEQVN